MDEQKRDFLKGMATPAGLDDLAIRLISAAAFFVLSIDVWHDPHWYGGWRGGTFLLVVAIYLAMGWLPINWNLKAKSDKYHIG